jgi:tetratricopeptide (TPR) repeat protein
MSDPTADRDPFEVVAESFLAQYRAGHRPSITEYAAQFPELAEQIHELLPALAMLEQDLTIDPDPSGEQPFTAASPGEERRLGDYRILREIARGGMGVVYEAEQVSLGRRVALKVLPGHLAEDSHGLERFRREAKAAAKLHHTNIVPVFEVGRDGNVAYYAMQFIQGQGLDQVIDELLRLRRMEQTPSGAEEPGPTAATSTRALQSRAPGPIVESLLSGRFKIQGAAPSSDILPVAISRFAGDTIQTSEFVLADSVPTRAGATKTPVPSAVLPGGSQVSMAALSGRRAPFFRSVAEIGHQAAQGLAYAHASGIVHRDIKPSNLLLDHAGVTWITDFGLAKGEDEGLTHTSDILGTLSYMAPERFRGEGDARADIYGLGLTLYELLTLRSAFKSRDRLKMIEQIKNQEPPRPRAVDSRIPRDLETIVLKAIEKDPLARYQSADAMAEDLGLFLADEPIRARQISASERSWRWARRNPAIAVVGGVLMALLVAVSVGSMLAASYFRRALVRETQARAALAEANTKVQARYELALDAIQTFHTGASEDFLLKQDQFKDQRQWLLKSAAEFYGKLSALLGKETDLASRRALADSNFELADLMNQVGDKEAALAAHRAVLAAREALAAEPGSGSGILVDVDESLTAMAEILDLLGRTDDAVEAYRRSESLLAGPAASDRAVRDALANCRSGLGSFLYKTGKRAEALAACRLARADQQALAAGPGASTKARRDLAATVERIAWLLAESGKLTEAESEYRTALAIQQELVGAKPTVTGFRHDLAFYHDHLGVVFDRMGKWSEAEAEFRTMVAIEQKLADDNPAVTEFRRKLALGHNNRGEMLRRAGKLSEAETEFRTALAIRQKLVDDNPAAIHYRYGLALSHDSLGLVLRDKGKPAAAEAESRIAVALLQQLVHDNPAVAEFRKYLGLIHNDLGDLLRSLGRPSEAEGEYRTALAILKQIADDSPTNAEFRMGLAIAQNNLGLQLARGKRFPEAFTALETGLAIRQKQVDADLNNSAYMKDLGWSYADRGKARVLACQPALASADLRQACELWAKVPSLDTETRFEQAGVLALLAGLGKDLKSGVTAAEAAAFADQSIAALRDMITAGWARREELKEPEFASLRGREDFKKLLAELEAKHEGS